MSMKIGIYKDNLIYFYINYSIIIDMLQRDPDRGKGHGSPCMYEYVWLFVNEVSVKCMTNKYII